MSPTSGHPIVVFSDIQVLTLPPLGMLYSVSAVIPSEQSAAGSLFQVRSRLSRLLLTDKSILSQAMTALAPSLGIVFATLVSSSQKSVAEPDREHRYAFFTAMAYSLFAFVAAGPCLWGIGVVSSGEVDRSAWLGRRTRRRPLRHAEAHSLLTDRQIGTIKARGGIGGS